MMNKKCFFCDNKSNPDYKDYEVLSKFIDSQGKILSKSYTGLCAKHQRRTAQAIKRARHLAFLPFVS